VLDEPAREEALQRLASACSSAQRLGPGRSIRAVPAGSNGNGSHDATQDAGVSIDLLLRHLTPRESDVLDAIRSGSSTAEMADQLGISRDTVRVHVKNLLAKLQVHSRVEAAAVVSRSHGEKR
jgi:DNA-binding NarL/FixJ family response regulator